MKQGIQPITRAQARVIAANIRSIYAQPHAPVDDGKNVHDRVVAANAALFTEATFSQPLTDFAVGFRDTNDIENTLQFFAPRVRTSRRFEYSVASNIEEFFSEVEDDLRPIGADFKDVGGYTETKVNGKTENRGLTITVDHDQVDMALDNADTEDSSNIKRFVSPCEDGGDVRVYEQQLTAKLTRISVEHYEKTAITSTLGIRKFTVS